MYYECSCVEITPRKWDELMKGNRPCSKRTAVKAALETGIISEDDAKRELRFHYYNPYSPRRTKKHIIYIHSGIEHFIRL